MQKPLFQQRDGVFLNYKQFDEMLYVSKVTQIANGISPQGNCILNHCFDDKSSFYPIYAERFLAKIYQILNLTPRTFLIIINFISPLLIYLGLYLILVNFNLSTTLFNLPILASCLLVSGVLGLKPYFHEMDFNYHFPFERILNPLVIIIPSIFFFSFLTQIYADKKNKYTIFLTGLFCGLSFYTQAYYYFFNSLFLIIIFLSSIIRDRSKTYQYFKVGILALIIGSPVIWHVLFGVKPELQTEKMWLIGMMLPTKYYFFHKGVIFVMLTSILLSIFQKKYRNTLNFLILYQILYFLLTGLTFVTGKELLTLHFQYFNVISYAIFYSVLSQSAFELLQNKLPFKIPYRYLSYALLIAILTKGFLYTIDDLRQFKLDKNRFDKIFELYQLVGDKYKGQIMLGPETDLNFLMANNNINIFAHRFYNFCDLHPEKILNRNLLLLKVYNASAPILNQECSYYWPWMGFVIDEFKDGILDSCQKYNEYIVGKFNNIDIVNYLQFFKEEKSTLNFLIQNFSKTYLNWK
jgi:hypothetical protein